MISSEKKGLVTKKLSVYFPTDYLSRVSRRPSDRERRSLIRSGSVFIYDGNASGIKRWRDGVKWSPSRVLGNFLVYRELDKPFPPGAKMRAMSKQQRPPSNPGGSERPMASSSSDRQSAGVGIDPDASEIERQLVGSLVDSYEFKQNGLIEKTISVTVQGVTNHLISYYRVNDVVSNQLRTPSQVENLRYIRPRTELICQQKSRCPTADVERVGSAAGAYTYYVDTDGSMRDTSRRAQYYTLQMAAPYLQSPASTSLKQAQGPGHSQFYRYACSRGYDPSSRASSTSDREPPHPGDMCRLLQMHRPVNNFSIVSMGSGNPVPYKSSPYPVNTTGAQMNHTRQNQPSYSQVEHGVYRGSEQQPSRSSPSLRTPYYPEHHYLIADDVSGSATWLTVCTRLGFPVSTTQSIVGALVGVGIASDIPVNWGWRKSSVSQIAASWTIAPCIAAGVGAVIFVYYAVTAGILSLFIVISGGHGIPTLKAMGAGEATGIILGVSASTLVVAAVFFLSYYYAKLIKEDRGSVPGTFPWPHSCGKRTIPCTCLEKPTMKLYRTTMLPS
ncbi:Global transcription regulator sge1 [Exophiala xenobiotica]|nr:Global transcription regulator sge1 [Exophiala xenobiotica]KAK5356027.1 Global transcription regulator sge1 [Exophiala xenobiotica]KAK5356199.1 Global transcription regulator sge1 [Exophiala xenobiotica]